MPQHWVDRPKKYPYRCAISGKSEAKDGPYFDMDLEVLRHDGGAIEHLYIREKYMLAAFQAPGSPYRVLSQDEAHKLIEENELLRENVAGKVAEIEDLQVALDRQADVFARARTRKTTARRKPRPKKDEDEQ